MDDLDDHVALIRLKSKAHKCPLQELRPTSNYATVKGRENQREKQ